MCPIKYRVPTWCGTVKMIFSNFQLWISMEKKKVVWKNVWVYRLLPPFQFSKVSNSEFLKQTDHTSRVFSWCFEQEGSTGNVVRVSGLCHVNKMSLSQPRTLNLQLKMSRNDFLNHDLMTFNYKSSDQSEYYEVFYRLCGIKHTTGLIFCHNNTLSFIVDNQVGNPIKICNN